MVENTVADIAPLKQEEFQKHLEKEHKVNPVSANLKEIVYGGTDGIVTTFAVVAGFAGATGGNSMIVGVSVITVLIFGLANLFADGVSMSLGNFLSIRADKDIYKKNKEKERDEIRKSKDFELSETALLLETKGFTKDQAQKITELYAENEEYWVDFMMRYELGLPNAEDENPIVSSVATFIAFILFGSIPIAPYILFQSSLNIFLYSVTATALALIILGYLRGKVANMKYTRTVLESLLLGGTAAFVAYLVGTLFRL
jgi:VIT1/CCC1 family predicted Fe2+/Mn2+ transporter